MKSHEWEGVVIHSRKYTKHSPNVKCISLTNGNHLSNTSKGYLKSTNGPLLKAMNGKELYSVLSLLKNEKRRQ